MAANLGSKAPNFQLLNTEAEKVNLSDFENSKNVVLLFFPYAFSGVCTEEVCTTRDNMKLYNSLDAEVIGISVDSFFTLREFKKSHNLNFTLLSDFNKKAAPKYDALYDDYFGMKGVTKRASYVIDKQGIVRYKEILDNSDNLPDFNKIQNVLFELE